MASVAAVHIQLVKDGNLEYTPKISASDKAAELAHKLIKQNDREHMIVLSLNGQNRPVNINIVHVGTSDSCQVEPRDILKPAILSNASRIIVIHNHPSEETTPSEADKRFTQNLFSACKIMGLGLLDSIIIGGPGIPHYSFAEYGKLTGVVQ